MSQKEKADPIGRLEVGELPNASLSRLTELARQAYERKGTKECLDLTRAMLLIDPDNAEAQWMRSSIQSDLHRDLENARAFLRQVHSKEDVEKQSPPAPATLVAEPEAGVTTEDEEQSAGFERTLQWTPPLPNSGGPRAARLLVAAALIVLVGGALAFLPLLRTRWNPVEASPLILNASDGSGRIVGPNGAPQAPLSANSAQGALSATASILPPAPAPVLVSALAPAVPRVTPKLLDVAAPVPGTGTLAISSPTSVDIYKDDVYLGAVPISLELPAGTHFLEYRHGNLRKNVTYVVNSNETTKATITFDVSVQINSKPWAEVFIDGVERKALGQTPLGSVRVPIGSVLIFENPKFQPKKYRVTGNETGIQIVFP